MNWATKLFTESEELLEDIIAPLTTIKDRLKTYLEKKDVAISDEKAAIHDLENSIQKHEQDKVKAITALANVSALFQ